MSTVKNHVVHGKYILSGDSRGVVVRCELRSKVWAWAEQNNITIEYQGSLSCKDLWYIKNEKDRAWFMLRWL